MKDTTEVAKKVVYSLRNTKKRAQPSVLSILSSLRSLCFSNRQVNRVRDSEVDRRELIRDDDEEEEFVKLLIQSRASGSGSERIRELSTFAIASLGQSSARIYVMEKRVKEKNLKRELMEADGRGDRNDVVGSSSVGIRGNKVHTSGGEQVRSNKVVNSD
ncbi:uncharacterized protein G2W53_008152 [Senna tora]|uniref:Uncharacterized protein n=1 Tax=Senna tora TaxID=362788 RepID=A0A835CGP2_9FABA|nr:uncharacterized protein G2W53_008152 [Senna tora]